MVYVEQDALVMPPEPTPRPTYGKVLPVQNSVASVTNALPEDLYYPHYGDGTSIECRNDIGEEPEWISRSMMKASKYECCTAYFFPSWAEECIADHPFYPKFEDASCVNDGNHPDWMGGGDYLSSNLWACCYNFFHDDASLEKCTGIPPCDNCDISSLLLQFDHAKI